MAVKKHNIRAVFFDLGGVCLTNGWEKDARIKAAEHFGFDPEEYEVRHRHVLTPFEEGRMNIGGYLAFTVFYKRRSFNRDIFIRFMQAQSKAYPPSMDVLKRLTKEGKYLLAALNNESRELNDFRINKFDLRKYFSHFFSSCFLGVRKPNSRIYTMALDISQCAPQEVLFIDDRIENAEAARAVGMQAIHLKDAACIKKEVDAYGI